VHRGQNIARLAELYCELSRKNVARLAQSPGTLAKQSPKTVPHVNPLSISVVLPQTPEKGREVFNKAEAYLKKYELASGRACVSGIYHLFDATCCLANKDFQTFVERCYFAQINILLDIVAHFSKELMITHQQGTIAQNLQGKSTDEKIRYLEGVICELEQRWCNS
jgi:hypothetical protein